MKIAAVRMRTEGQSFHFSPYWQLVLALNDGGAKY